MERRLYQRIPVQVSVIVTTEDGVRIKVVAVDVSSGGLGVECNTKQRNMITPGGSFVRDGKSVSVFVDLNLSDKDDQSSKIVARCHVVFSRRVSSDQCKIGLRVSVHPLSQTDANSSILLTKFLTQPSYETERP